MEVRLNLLVVHNMEEKNEKVTLHLLVLFNMKEWNSWSKSVGTPNRLEWKC